MASTQFKELPIIYGFPDGLTVVAYKKDGNEAITGGTEGTGIKIYDTGSQEYMSTDITEHVENVTCIATAKNGIFASSGSDGLVLLYTKQNTFDKILVRSSVAVRDMCFHPNGTKLAIASDENSIRIVLVADNSKIVLLEGHTCAVKSVSYDPTGNYIVSSDINGNIRIWDVSPNVPAPKCIKVLAAYSYRSDIDSLSKAKVAWHPDGTCFAFPGINNDIRVFRSGTWMPFYSLENQHTLNVSTLAWSPNGYYLASVSEDHSIAIWNTKTKSTVRFESSVSLITDLSWNPTLNEIALTDVHGQIRIWKEVIPTDNSNYPHPAIIRKKPNDLSDKIDIKFEKQASLPAVSQSLFADEEASEMEEEGEDLEMMDEEGEDVEEDVGDFVIDDDGAGYVEKPEQVQQNGQKQQPSLHLQGNTSAIVQRQRKLELAFDPPTTFQPCETPYHKPEDNPSFEPAQGERRYMAYNLIGAISTIFEDGHSIINVEFHDQSEYRNFHFTDMLNFTMGAISSAGTVFAVEAKETVKKTKKVRIHNEDEDDLGSDDEEEDVQTTQLNSTLYYRPINWGTDKDWTHHMLPGEDVVSIAINRVSVIATTSLGYVRIFSISGVQRHIFSLENVVSITAMTDLAMIVYSNGPAFNHQQNLQYLLINTDTNEVIQKDSIQLTADSELTWIGFSETNQAATYDSAGVLRVLHRQRRPYQGAWVPVFDGSAYAASQERTEKYWPVGVLRDRFMCVVLRGSNTYPFFPRPPVKDIPLQLPLLELSTEVGQLEEQVLRINTCNLHERDEAEATNTEEDYAQTFHEADIEMDIALLKLINLACKAEKVSRALDLTYTLHTSDSIDKAIRIASFHRYTSLAEKMTNIKEAKFMGSEQPTPSSLADSLAALPSIYTSTQSGLDNDLSFVKRERNAKRTAVDEDSSMMDTQLSKKSKPFQFSH